MKKSRIVFVVMLSCNLIESALLPFILVATIFGLGLTGQNALMWILLILELAFWCGTAIVANIMAGYNVKTRWYSAVLPFIFSLPLFLTVCSPENADSLLILAIFFAINILTCVVPLLVTARRQRKKAAVQAEENEKIIKENNETV